MSGDAYLDEPCPYVAGFAQGSWGASCQHAVPPERIEEAKNRYGVGRGGVTVKAVCGSHVVPSGMPYGSHYHFRCRRCERILTARAASEVSR